MLFDNQSPVVYLAIGQRSEDLKHHIPGTWPTELQGEHKFVLNSNSAVAFFNAVTRTLMISDARNLSKPSSIMMLFVMASNSLSISGI